MQRTRRGSALARSATSKLSRSLVDLLPSFFRWSVGDPGLDANSQIPGHSRTAGETTEPHSHDAHCHTRGASGENHRNRRNRRKPAPQKAIATSPRTSSNFTICRARRGRAHHRRAWKRGLTKSLPILFTRSCSSCGRLLAPGRRRREFDDFTVEAAVAASPPPPLLLLPLPLPLPPMFHSFTRRRTKILPPAGPFTRSRFSVDSRRRSIPPRGETRFPPLDGHTKNRPSLSLSPFCYLSFSFSRSTKHVSAISYPSRG